MSRGGTYLLPLSPQSEEALPEPRPVEDMTPLRVGRDLRSRRRFHWGRDRRTSETPGPNDIYLRESGHRLRISREHFLIRRREDGFYLEDRHSACGTLVNGELVGGRRRGGQRRLQHGDVIHAGGQASPWTFMFHCNGEPPDPA